MKSLLALHLLLSIVLLLLLEPIKFLTTASALSTTTVQPPSLRAPPQQRHTPAPQPTSVMTTVARTSISTSPTTTTTTTLKTPARLTKSAKTPASKLASKEEILPQTRNRNTRQPLASRQQQNSAHAKTAESSAATLDDYSAEASLEESMAQFDSARLVRNVNASLATTSTKKLDRTTSRSNKNNSYNNNNRDNSNRENNSNDNNNFGNNVRQHRSLQSEASQQQSATTSSLESKLKQQKQQSGNKISIALPYNDRRYSRRHHHHVRFNLNDRSPAAVATQARAGAPKYGQEEEASSAVSSTTQKPFGSGAPWKPAITTTHRRQLKESSSQSLQSSLTPSTLQTAINDNSNNDNHNNNNDSNNFKTASSNDRHDDSFLERSALFERSDTAAQNVAFQSPPSKNSTKLQQTLKTPRMIQRLVAGHLHNAEGHSSFQASSVTVNSTISKSTTTTTTTTVTSPTSTTAKPGSLYFGSKPGILSSSYRQQARPSKVSEVAETQTAKLENPAKPRDSSEKETGNNLNADDDDSNNDTRNDDEALLDEAGDFDNWDNGILRLSAGSGKEASSKPKKAKDDSKKTLSDQVRDGKYGLIEKELFRREPKRPGILSYLPNKEVPLDNEKSLGGLAEEDIWLAEDHLLVIKGGSLNEDEINEPWTPIDDYDAPGRQIKIPPKPKVPPPFPVQLEENGPIQLIGDNKFTVVYPIANESIPVYTIRPETSNAPTGSDSDDEKNLVTGPRTPTSVTEGGNRPTYVYPAAYPSWLFTSNKTFVNPLLKNTNPLSIAGLGPFPLRSNGSLDNANGTDYFDEDDPSLYYPPAYSFVYKNNYTSAVPPGPLVPGIVVPPPPDQFSRLEKPASSTPVPHSRHRIHVSVSSSSSSSTTPTTTTTTTTTTTPAPITSTTTSSPPFYEVITKISQYTPKVINISPSPKQYYSTSAPITDLPPTPPPTHSTTQAPPLSPIAGFDPVPVPVAVPIPVYPSNQFPTNRPQLVSFVPTTPEPERAPFTKSNPIYYEYFEAKRQPSSPNVIDEFLASTVKPPPSPKPIKLYVTSKRPFKQQQHLQPQRNYLRPVLQPHTPHQQQQFVKENVVYITPKPEMRYKAPPQAPIFKPRPLVNFEREVSALRETLRYYKNQQLRDNTIPRAPKAKPIYEFSFDATKNLRPTAENSDNGNNAGGNFQPPAKFDEEPFKPMVTYSPPLDDENAFRAMAYDKLDNEVANLQQKEARQEPSPKYQSTTLIPVQPGTADFTSTTSDNRSKKLRPSGKYLQGQQNYAESYSQGGNSNPTAEPPWVAIDKQPYTNYETAQLREQRPVSERLQVDPNGRNSFSGYYYAPQQQPEAQVAPVRSRQNNRFYDEPFQTPKRKIINYRPQYADPSYQYPQQQQQQQANGNGGAWSLENDTYVNYAPNRPPLNPDAEFIDPYLTVPVNPYSNQQGGQRYPAQLPQQSQPPPAISHQSQYYAPVHRVPPARQQIPLHRDTLVNYRPPYPPINPESEFISHPNVVRNPANQFFRSNAYQRLPQPPSPLDDAQQQPNFYYSLSPKYRRANNNNSNNNNNGRISHTTSNNREGRDFKNAEEQ